MEFTDDPHHPSGSGSCLSDQQRPAPFVEKEHMFDKVVTPSDVGKLNRLVIPKQNAEKYFPLDAAGSQKGLMLSFEDRTGRSWRFRYSYWNSSQSYVMTKGWSRFVKERRLDAGDVVSFGRGVGEAGRGRFFIDWKHHPDAHDLPRLSRLALPSRSYHHRHRAPLSMMPFTCSAVPWNRFVRQPPTSPFSSVRVYDHHRHLGNGYNAAAASNTYLDLRQAGSPPQIAVQFRVGESAGDGELGVPVVFDSVPVVQSNAVAKRVRLFGVNLDCPSAQGNAGGDTGLPWEPSAVRTVPSPNSRVAGER